MRGRLSQNGERWRRREERARMMKRTLTASPKVLPFTFRFPLPPSLTLQVSSKRQNSAKISLPLLPQRDLTRQQRQHDPLTIGHPVVISLSQAAGFLPGSEFQFSPPFPCFPPIPSFPPSFKEFECNLGLLPPSLSLIPNCEYSGFQPLLDIHGVSCTLVIQVLGEIHTTRVWNPCIP